MSSVVIRGGDGNRYPALVNSEGKLMVDTELSVSGVTIENLNVYRNELGNLSHGLVNSSTFHQQVDLYGLYDSTKPAAVADGAVAKLLSDQYGRLLPGMEPERFQASVQSFDATTPVQIKAKTASKKMYITTVAVSASGAMSVRLQDDAGSPATLVDETYLAAKGSLVLPFSPSAPLVVTTNQDLDLVADVAGGVTVTVTGYLAS